MSSFLVQPLIVLLTRKALIGLLFKPTHVFPLSLASSVHHLPSNLVSSLEPMARLKSNQLLVVTNLYLGAQELHMSSHYT